MFYTMLLSCDARQIIADCAKYDYIGLLHSIAMEYIESYNVTLIYFFNMESSDQEKVFPKESWLWENSVEITDGRNNSFENPTKIDYYLTLNTYSNDKSYYLSQFKISDRVVKIFGNMNSILEFKEVYRNENIRNKIFSIWIDEGSSAGSLDFDSIEELKEKLESKYSAKRIVPITYSPWDSTDEKINDAKYVNELDLLYLYEFQKFQIRIY